MTKTAASPILHLIRRAVEDQRLKELPDQELLRRFSSARDEAAFAALLRRHGQMVLDICRSMLANAEDAEDAFQATFLVLAQRAGAIRRPWIVPAGVGCSSTWDRPALPGRETLKGSSISVRKIRTIWDARDGANRRHPVREAASLAVPRRHRPQVKFPKAPPAQKFGLPKRGRRWPMPCARASRRRLWGTRP